MFYDSLLVAAFVFTLLLSGKRLSVIIFRSGAGWSSLAARRAHNPKVAGSNPAPATNFEVD